MALSYDYKETDITRYIPMSTQTHTNTHPHTFILPVTKLGSHWTYFIPYFIHVIYHAISYKEY